MSKVCIDLKKRGISVVLMTEDELDEIQENEQILEKIKGIASKYVDVVCSEVQKMNLNSRQQVMLEIMIVNRLQDAMVDSLGRMYDEGLLEKAE